VPIPYGEEWGFYFNSRSIMFNLLQNKKGFLFITTYLVIIVFTVLSLSFFARTLNERNLTKIDMNSLLATYAADKGIECVIREIEEGNSCGYYWETHEVEDALPFQISQKYYEGSILPVDFITLQEYCKLDLDASSQYYGCYVARDGSFAAKIYRDPNPGHEDEMIALVLGISGPTTRLFVIKLCSSSLYRYFLFTPYQLDMAGKTWEAETGTLHSNEDIVFGENVIVNDVGEFSTPQYIRYDVNSYIPEGDIWEERYWSVRNPWITANNGEYYDGIYTEYYNKNDGHVFGDQYGLKMEDPTNPGTYITWDGTEEHPPIFPDAMPGIYSGSVAQINTIPISNRLPATYEWNKYYGPTEDYGYSPEYVDVEYTNSYHQASAWRTYMADVGLNTVVKEHSSGGESVPALSIREDAYQEQANESGVYVYESLITPIGYAAKINGTVYSPDEEGKIIIGGDIVFEKKSFINTNSMRENEPIVIHVDEMINHAVDPSNGIIFSDVELMLTDAAALQPWGLTTVGRENIYIKGNYNTEGWAPSTAMTAKFTYLLSDEFDFPQALPATLHNLEYPYVADYVEGEYNYYAENYKSMPNAVDSDYKYVLSLFGYYGYEPCELERWTYPQKVGNKNKPPSEWLSKIREVQGAFVQLEPEDFSPSGDLDFDTVRPGRRNLGWPEYMTSIVPTPTRNILRYEPQYTTGFGCPLYPPGEMYGISESVWLEIENTLYNWEHHYIGLN